MRIKLLGCFGILFVPFFVLFIYVAYHGLTNGYTGVTSNFVASPLLTSPPPVWKDEHVLKVVTFNIQDLMIVGRNRPERMRAIAAKLMVIDPDIVGFQEAFIAADRQILLDDLKNTRLQYNQYYPSGSVGSGVLICSIFPIEEVYFHQYTKANPWYKMWEGDWWAGKGVGLARIKIAEGHYLDFFNTHAQAGYGNAAYKIVREQQMTEAAEFVNGANCPTIPALFVGDLNCSPGSPDYQALYDGANMERLMTIESHIDHILGVKNPAYTVETLETFKIQEVVNVNKKQFTLSDHNGYMSTLKIGPAKEASPVATQ